MLRDVGWEEAFSLNNKHCWAYDIWGHFNRRWSFSYHTFFHVYLSKKASSNNPPSSSKRDDNEQQDMVYASTLFKCTLGTDTIMIFTKEVVKRLLIKFTYLKLKDTVSLTLLRIVKWDKMNKLILCDWETKRKKKR